MKQSNKSIQKIKAIFDNLAMSVKARSVNAEKVFENAKIIIKSYNPNAECFEYSKYIWDNSEMIISFKLDGIKHKKLVTYRHDSNLTVIRDI